MKFTQFTSTRYSTKDHKFGYTLYALGEDGRVYKGAFNGSIHVGWIPLSDQILPPDWELTTWESRTRKGKTPLSSTEAIA